MSGKTLPLLASATTGIFVGVGLVLTRYAITETGPMSVAFLRYLFGVLYLLPFLLSLRFVPFQKRDLLPVILLGIGQFGILIGLINYAVTVIHPGQAALIFAVFPLLTMGFAVAIGQEPFTLRRALGIALTIVGVGFSIGGAALGGELSDAQWLGVGAAFLSAVTGAFCSVLYRPFLMRYPTLQIGGLAMFAATLFLGGLAVPEGLFDAWPDFSTGVWLALLGIGAVSGVGYLLWLYALQRVWASNVAAFMGLSPLTASLLGLVFLGEAVTLADGLGVALVVAGLSLALWRGR